MTSENILKSDINKCKSICNAIKFGNHNTAINYVNLQSNIWALPPEEINERLIFNIRYDCKNGTNSACKLAKTLCEMLQEELVKLCE